jgi:(1->4)-alpha-D-glucan 1-alpha-D-glucosylmutase
LSDNRALDPLCAYFGIASRYTDAQGQEHQVPGTTKRAILAALGVAVGDAETDARSLEAAIDRDWQRILPPVVVLWEGTTKLQLPLTLPDEADLWRLRWALSEEQGATSEGTLDPRELASATHRSIARRKWRRLAWDLTPPRQPGYHRLNLYGEAADSPLASTRLIIAPRRCFVPEGVDEDHRAWGLATTLHGVRSARDWGIGDFTDLTRLLELCGKVGAGALATGPLHALFPGRPERSDPFEPSSRLVLNVVHLDVEAVPELGECEEARSLIGSDAFQAQLRALRAESLVDYGAVTRAKLSVLERLYRHFREHHLEAGSPRADAFGAFCRERGDPLRRFALFEALREGLADSSAAPADWPEAYRRIDSQEVADFAHARAARVDFFAWLQWLAHQQLEWAGRRSLELRLALGLCPDLAMGAAPDGAEVWAEPGLYVGGVRIASPPGDDRSEGRDSAALPWHPAALRDAAYAPLAAILRANMREAGALRVDSIRELVRPFLVPTGTDPAAGTYLRYPFADVLGVLTLESVRNQCLVIGDKLDGMDEQATETFASSGILSTRLLLRDRGEDGGFPPPSQLAPQTAVFTGTHDLPTLAGFWRGTDLEQRRALGLYKGEPEYEELLVRRSNDRALLFLALDHEGLLPEDSGADPVAVPELTPAYIAAVYTYLARAPSRLLWIQTTDLLGQLEQVSLRNSGDAYPNWRQRHHLDLESWLDQPAITGLLAAVRDERGVSTVPGPPATDHGPSTPLHAPIPRATYRLQLHRGFGFRDAAELVPYLADLGISHCYFSPYLEARPGSTHGYDVIAHDRLNPELGSPSDFEQLCETLAAQGMGQILDMVPNHVGVMGAKNRWWLDVLENGPASRFSDFFDIDWSPLKRELRGKVLVPVLGDHYGNALDSGSLRLVFAEGAFRIEYYEHHFPIDPREYTRILAPGLSRLRSRLAENDEMLTAFESLVTAFGNLPSRESLDEGSLTERRRDKELHKQRLAELRAGDADLDWYVKECLRDFNGAEGYPADAGRLHALLEAQAYRLAHWRVAADEINYRRFFDINDLAALRIENPETFEDTHRLVLDLIGQGKLAGLRIDHPDGLYDPAEYFRRLQQRVSALQAPGWRTGDPTDRPLYLVVEKILSPDEQLPADWPVHGTTGYDFSALVDGLLVDPQGAEPLGRCYQEFVGAAKPLAVEIHTAKRLVMRNLLSSELHVLASELSRIAEEDAHTRDYTLDALRDALREIVACFPVYRTYITPEGVSQRDRNQILKAVSQARRLSQAADLSVFGFVQSVLLTDIAEGKPDAYRRRVRHLAMKLQQYTGPVTAKGVEDTAFYRYHRLTSLNEVGGDPERFGISVETFHRANTYRRENWPHALLAGSTHDSKRSEDIRARLHVLSELPDEWREHVERWARLNRRLRRAVADLTVPDPNTEYLLYQTLLGVWPLEDSDPQGLSDLRERVRLYMDKAVKEAKVHTAWTHADTEYEAALSAFIESVLDPEHNRAFFDDFLPFKRRIARLGLYNALSQTLLRLTAPGVPDIYQGCELWSFSLVDPDNRRPVDFDLRRSLASSLTGTTADALGSDCRADLIEHLDDGRAKLYLIRQALALRRSDPDLFAHGDYAPLALEGPNAQHLCAYARTHEGRSVTVLAPRLIAGLGPHELQPANGTEGEWDSPFTGGDWESTWVEVPSSVLTDALSGVTLSASARDGRYVLAAAEVLRRFPVGLLISGEGIQRQS